MYFVNTRFSAFIGVFCRKKNKEMTIMKKSLLFKILTLFTFMLVVVSCDTAAEENPDEQTPTYVGTWKNTYGETYNITESTFICDSNGYGFEAANLVIDKKDNKSGVFYMQITKNNSWWSNSDPVGKWYAVAFKNMTDTTLSLSNACTAYPECEMDCQDSLEKAKAHFTVDEYFTFFADFAKE
jgi:hypothetical protein